MNTRLMVLGGVLAAFFVMALAASNVKAPSVETGSVPQAILEERARLATEHNPYMRKER
jgi:hypothetical protein